jgi:hypothetical protein
MDFNLQAISLADGVAMGASIPVPEMLGRNIEFRAGVSISVTLPASMGDFASLPDPEKLMPVLTNWARVYRFPQAEADQLHVLAPAETDEGELEYRRLELLQPRSRRGPRLPASIAGGAIMNGDECARWLVELAMLFAANPQSKQLQTILARPRLPKPGQMRLAWIGPELVDGRAMGARLNAIGSVLGAQIISIPPRSFHDARERLEKAKPIDAVVICRHYAPYISLQAVPESVSGELIHECDSVNSDDLENQVRAWIEISEDAIASRIKADQASEPNLLLAIMLRGMLSHSKIGPFNHCQKTTVLTGVRARRMNVPRAEAILDDNTESYEETRDSGSLFLFKGHNDGPQYFLNPRRVEEAKGIIVRTIK